MNKVDKGFELFYYKLSHRRKFIRTILLTVLGIVCMVAFYFLTNDGGILAPFATGFFDKAVTLGACLFILMVGAMQAGYEYRKWKEEQ